MRDEKHSVGPVLFVKDILQLSEWNGIQFQVGIPSRCLFENLDMEDSQRPYVDGSAARAPSEPLPLRE